MPHAPDTPQKSRASRRLRPRDDGAHRGEMIGVEGVPDSQCEAKNERREDGGGGGHGRNLAQAAPCSQP